MSIDLSTRFASGFAAVTAASQAKGAAEVFDPFAVVRNGAVPESNRFVQALERLYGMAEGSLTAAPGLANAASGETSGAATPLQAQAEFQPTNSGWAAAAPLVPTSSTAWLSSHMAANAAVAPIDAAHADVGTLSAWMRQATEQNVAGVTRQVVADALLGPWAAQAQNRS